MVHTISSIVDSVVPAKSYREDVATKLYTEEELLQEYPELQQKYENFETVLDVEGSAYFYQEADSLFTVYGLRGRRVEYLVTKIGQKADAIYLEPSTISEGSQIADLANSMIVKESEMNRYVPDIEKLSYYRFGPTTHFDRLKKLTAKGKYWFHSAKGRNFLATRVGTDENGEPWYRLYEFCVESQNPLTLRRPSHI
ncbi:hypothetical protein [Planktothrix mougeotii]|uniref:Uncharacterized protein n=1 Tax=Planktothrix mougeotii LEGE 06226 TaxID=1828728 RepID=A0ABR9U8R4_9CYAN|nr:hypothetical protein [Planktothrix mougeotii]MBE9142827.1 hypothetical protein [Planktothrix mougeotii LEGE 06226]